MAISEELGRDAFVIDVASQSTSVPLATQLYTISKESGLSPIKVASAYMRLAFGQGKISFADFVRLRLFDEAFQDGADLNAYVGQRHNRDICVAANYRHDWFGVVTNKLASFGYLSAYGLPVIAINAVFAPRLTIDRPFILRDRAAVQSYLTSPDSYPLFGKPLEGFQSLGSIALTGCIMSTLELEKADGARISLDRFLDDIETHYSAGYIFQPLTQPAASISALCGNRLACLRVITALTEDGPKVIRTAWKIPGGANSADNYWRPGNLLAQMDLQTGRVLRATSGAGLGTQLHSRHPDTDAVLTGFAYPNWTGALAMALEAARVMQHVPLIGWDMAETDQGLKIVEMNATPDFFLAQFADRRGMLDEEFKAFLRFQAANASAHEKFMKSALQKL